jgi:GNAT superfamily N-acetyltransferase
VESRPALEKPGRPEDPPIPLGVVIAGHHAQPARTRRWEFRAWAPDGTLAGHAQCSIDPAYDDNPDLLPVDVFVHPSHRRNGVATDLLARLVALANAEGRTRLTGWSTSRFPAGAAFAAACGARVVARGHINHLMIATIDRRGELERWVADGPVRARLPDRRLGRCDPRRHVVAFADLYHVMNDAPLDDLETNDSTFTPEQLREWEAFVFGRESQVWTLVAQASDGTLAGFHNVNWKPYRPATLNVEDTGVRPEHRGHALGKWLKAAMTLRILDERPSVVDIRTGNADSNDAMLGINRAMGYAPLMSTTTFELGVEPDREQEQVTPVSVASEDALDPRSSRAGR